MRLLCSTLCVAATCVAFSNLAAQQQSKRFVQLNVSAYSGTGGKFMTHDAFGAELLAGKKLRVGQHGSLVAVANLGAISRVGLGSDAVCIQHSINEDCYPPLSEIAYAGAMGGGIARASFVSVALLAGPTVRSGAGGGLGAQVQSQIGFDIGSHVTLSLSPRLHYLYGNADGGGTIKLYGMGFGLRVE